MALHTEWEQSDALSFRAPYACVPMVLLSVHTMVKMWRLSAMLASAKNVTHTRHKRFSCIVFYLCFQQWKQVERTRPQKVFIDTSLFSSLGQPFVIRTKTVSIILWRCLKLNPLSSSMILAQKYFFPFLWAACLSACRVFIVHGQRRWISRQSSWHPWHQHIFRCTGFWRHFWLGFHFEIMSGYWVIISCLSGQPFIPWKNCAYSEIPQSLWFIL